MHSGLHVQTGYMVFRKICRSAGLVQRKELREEMQMEHNHVVAGVFADVGAAEQARRQLIEAGISENNIVLTADMAGDDIAAEYPGQGYTNQPGQSFEPEHMDPCGAKVSGGVCELRVDMGSRQDEGAVERILRGCGAQKTRVLH